MGSRQKRHIPFSIDRDSGVGLVDQVVKGFRGEILCGSYSFGDKVPSLRKLSKLLGVSMKVCRLAYAKLATEGWLRQHPRIGFTVAAPDIPNWRGQVLLVLVDIGYHNATVSARIQKNLENAGYIVAYVIITRGEDGKYDYHSLDAVLTRKFDLVFSFERSDEVLSRIAYAENPYVTISIGSRMTPRDRFCRGIIEISESAAISDFTAACVAAGVRKAWCADFSPEGHGGFVKALRTAHIAVDHIRMSCDWRFGRFEAVRRAAYERFAALLARGRRKLPDVVLLLDDYIAQGAFSAFVAAGIRIPDDILMVSWANRGNGSVFGPDTPIIEMDPFEQGDRIADFLKANLSGGTHDHVLTIGPSFVRRSFPSAF